MASRPSTTQNNNSRIGTADASMTRFSVDAPPTSKRVRFSQSDHPSQSRPAAPVDQDSEDEDIPIRSVLSRAAAQVDQDEEDEDMDFVPIRSVLSDPQDSDEDEESEEEEEEEEDEAEIEELVSEDDDDDGEEVPAPAPEGQTQQITSSSDVATAIEPLHPFITDPDVLDCPICLEALCAPVFQCENGHIACSSCCSKVNRKCPSCCMPIGYNRCRAIEKIIESVKVPCKNTRYGCTEITLYNKRIEHEQMCLYATCFCPHPSCSFASCSKQLCLHFAFQHADSTTRFNYETTFSVDITTDQKHFFLVELQERGIFILNQEVRENERAFSIDCVGPNVQKTCFVYKLIVGDTDGAMYMRCVPDVYTKWSEHVLRRKYLAVPKDDFVNHNGTLSLRVRIKKV